MLKGAWCEGLVAEALGHLVEGAGHTVEGRHSSDSLRHVVGTLGRAGAVTGLIFAQ